MRHIDNDIRIEAPDEPKPDMTADARLTSVRRRREKATWTRPPRVDVAPAEEQGETASAAVAVHA